MIEGMGAALSGLKAYVNQTRTTANNLANLNTTGFKGSRTVQSSMAGNRGVATTSVQSLQTQGSVAYTGNGFDMAIAGDGFFRVATPGGTTGYTRAGSFKLDNQGRLADSNGATLSPEIQIPGGATDVTVGRDGSVSAMVGGQRQQIGQVELVKFNNPGGLKPGGSNIYYQTAESGQPVSGTPGVGGFGEITPSSLELSNVDIAEQMVGLIQARNGFAAQVKTIQTADEMLGATLNIKA